MKEKTFKTISRVARSLVNAILGEGIVTPTDHVRKVRGTQFQDTSC